MSIEKFSLSWVGWVAVALAGLAAGGQEMPKTAGDTLSGKVAIRESRISRSKPGMGFVRYTATLHNERGECVFVTTSSA